MTSFVELVSNIHEINVKIQLLFSYGDFFCHFNHLFPKIQNTQPHGIRSSNTNDIQAKSRGTILGMILK